MTPSTPSPSGTTARPADAERGVARLAGFLFLLTFAASIPPALLLYDPILNDVAYVLGGGADARIAVGALMEIVLMVANVGTAVVLYPVLRRQSEAASLGYVATRIIESTIIGVGIVSLLAVATLRTDAASADPASLTLVGQALVAVHDWTFLLGPAFCAGLGNGLLLGYLMLRSGLMWRPLAVLGLVGGTLATATATAVLLGVHDQLSTTSVIATIPEMIWELSVGFVLLLKGFRPSAAILRGAPETAAPAVARPARGRVIPEPARP